MKHAAPLPGSSQSNRPIADGVGRFETGGVLFTRPRNGDNEFAVFLGDKAFALAG